MATIGSELDKVFGDISAAMDAIESRVSKLEVASPPLSPVLETPSTETPSTETPSTETPSTEKRVVYFPEDLRDDTILLVPSGKEVGNVNIQGLKNVGIMVLGRVGDIEATSVESLSITGEGSIGSLKINEGSKRSLDVLVSGVNIRGLSDPRWPGTAFNINGVTNFSVSNIVADSLVRYGAWVYKCMNVYFSNCYFATQGVESCIRLVDTSFSELSDCTLKSDYKHCFRIHGNSNNIRLTATDLTGPRGIMMGTMDSTNGGNGPDKLTNITIDNNHIYNATTHFLGLPVSYPERVSNLRWFDNQYINCSPNFSEYTGSPWVFE